MSSPFSSINIVKWSSQGMLRLTQEAMNELFQPTINNIIKHIGGEKQARVRRAVSPIKEGILTWSFFSR